MLRFLFCTSMGVWSGLRFKTVAFSFTWHTERKWDEGQLAAARQGMSNYDRHQIEVWLTPQELQRLQQWAENRSLSRFHSPFPARSGAPSYGAASQSSLRVAVGTDTHALSWSGDSQVPAELSTAVQELAGICRGIETRRRGTD